MPLSIPKSPKSSQILYHAPSPHTNTTPHHPVKVPSNASSTFELLSPPAAKLPNDSSSNSIVPSRDGSSKLPSFSTTPSASLKKESSRIKSSRRTVRDGSVDTLGSSYPPSISSFVRPPRHPESLLTKYRTPSMQLALVSLISFLCPGMWNALNGLGGGGLVAPGPANTANVALYSTFSIAGFFAGIFTNKLGVRITLAAGGTGYAVYSSSLLCYKHTENEGFLIFAGCALGVCAGVFWAAQGMMTISYPGEGAKGKSIGWFWGIYNLGAVIGSMIALIQNLHSTSNSITDTTFYAIISLSALGILLSLILSSPANVIRSDGTHVSLPHSPSWKSEINGLLDALHSDYYILLLFPMFFASNVFYPYQFNTFNLANFTIRTRSLNNVVYWLAEIAGGYISGYLLDVSRVRRSVKARLAVLVLLVVTCAVWSGAYVWEVRVGKMEMKRGVDRIKMDFRDKGYVCPMALYMAFGLLAAAYQTCLYWFLGTLTTDSRKIANLAGFYKGIQSAGGAVSFRVNTLGISPVRELVMCWSLLAGALVVAMPVVVRKIRDLK